MTNKNKPQVISNIDIYDRWVDSYNSPKIEIDPEISGGELDETRHIEVTEIIGDAYENTLKDTDKDMFTKIKNRVDFTGSNSVIDNPLEDSIALEILEGDTMDGESVGIWSEKDQCYKIELLNYADKETVVTDNTLIPTDRNGLAVVNSIEGNSLINLSKLEASQEVSTEAQILTKYTKLNTVEGKLGIYEICGETLNNLSAIESEEEVCLFEESVSVNSGSAVIEDYPYSSIDINEVIPATKKPYGQSILSAAQYVKQVNNLGFNNVRATVSGEDQFYYTSGGAYYSNNLVTKMAEDETRGIQLKPNTTYTIASYNMYRGLMIASPVKELNVFRPDRKASIFTTDETGRVGIMHNNAYTYQTTTIRLVEGIYLDLSLEEFDYNSGNKDDIQTITTFNPATEKHELKIISTDSLYSNHDTNYHGGEVTSLSTSYASELLNNHRIPIETMTECRLIITPKDESTKVPLSGYQRTWLTVLERGSNSIAKVFGDWLIYHGNTNNWKIDVSFKNLSQYKGKDLAISFRDHDWNNVFTYYDVVLQTPGQGRVYPIKDNFNQLTVELPEPLIKIHEQVTDKLYWDAEANMYKIHKMVEKVNLNDYLAKHCLNMEISENYIMLGINGADLPNKIDYGFSSIPHMMRMAGHMYIDIPKTSISLAGYEVTFEGAKNYIMSLNAVYYSALKTPRYIELDDMRDKITIATSIGRNVVSIGENASASRMNIGGKNGLSEAITIFPSKTYTVAFNCSKGNNLTDLEIDLGGTSILIAKDDVLAFNKITITTPSILSHKEIRFIGFGYNVGKVFILEGVHANKRLDTWFTGIKHFGEHNLETGKHEVCVKTYNSNNLIDLRESAWTVDGIDLISNVIKVKPNTVYTYSQSVNSWRGCDQTDMYGTRIKTIFSASSRNTTFTTPKDCEYITVNCGAAHSDYKAPLSRQMQLQEGTKVLEFHNYPRTVDSEVVFELDAPLRKLGDKSDRLYWDSDLNCYCVEDWGLKEVEITNVSKELKKIITENTKTVNYMLFGGIVDYTIVGSVNNGTVFTMNNRLPDCVSYNIKNNPGGGVALYYSPSYGYWQGIILEIPKEQLISYDLDGLNAWLAEKPLHIYYRAHTGSPKIVPLERYNERVLLNTANNETYFDANSCIEYSKVTCKGLTEKLMIKPNKLYTVDFEVDMNNSDSDITIDLGGTKHVMPHLSILGRNRIEITTPKTLSHDEIRFIGTKLRVKNVMTIEGVVNKTGYFKGIQNVFDDNIIRIKSYTDCYEIPKDNIIAYSGKPVWHDDFLNTRIQVKPNTKYTIKPSYNILCYDKNGDFIERIDTESGRVPRDRGKFVTPSNCTEINLRAYVYETVLENFLKEPKYLINRHPEDVTNVELNPVTPIEVSININEPLRRIGDITDKLVVIENKLYIERNIGKYVYQGDEGFGNMVQNETYLCYAVHYNIFNSRRPDLNWNNMFMSESFINSDWTGNAPTMPIIYNKWAVLFTAVSRNKLTSNTLEGYIEYMKGKVIYLPYNEPVYEEVTWKNFAGSINLNCFREGYVSLETNIYPTTLNCNILRDGTLNTVSIPQKLESQQSIIWNCNENSYYISSENENIKLDNMEPIVIKTSSPQSFVEYTGISPASTRLSNLPNQYECSNIEPDVSYTVQFDLDTAEEGVIEIELGRATSTLTASQGEKRYKTEITTPTEMVDKQLLFHKDDSTVSNVMLFKGSTNQLMSYFEGNVSTGIYDDLLNVYNYEVYTHGDVMYMKNQGFNLPVQGYGRIEITEIQGNTIDGESIGRPCKNFLTTQQVISGLIDKYDGTLLTGGTYSNFKTTHDYIEIEPDTEYTPTCHVNDKVLSCRTFIFDEDKKIIQDTSEGTITTAANARYMRISVDFRQQESIPYMDNAKYMLSKGSQQEPFEEYYIGLYLGLYLRDNEHLIKDKIDMFIKEPLRQVDKISILEVEPNIYKPVVLRNFEEELVDIEVLDNVLPLGSMLFDFVEGDTIEVVASIEPAISYTLLNQFSSKTISVSDKLGKDDKIYWDKDKSMYCIDRAGVITELANYNKLIQLKAPGVNYVKKDVEEK